MIDLNSLLPTIQKYRELYWEHRAHELRGYLLDHEMRGLGLSRDEEDERWKQFHAQYPMDKESELCMAQLMLLHEMRGKGPEHVQRLQEEVIEKVGE